MRSVFFYSMSIGFASGIFARSFFDIGWPGICFLAGIGIAHFVAWRIKNGGFESSLFLVALICFSGTLGAARLNYAETSYSEFAAHEGKSVFMEARVVREPEVRSTMLHLYVKPEGTDEVVLVTTDRFLESRDAIRYGSTLTVEGTLERPQSFETDGGRIFDYEGYLKARGVKNIIPFAYVSFVGNDASFLTQLYDAKKRFMEALELAIPMPASGLGEGVLLGVKRALGEELEETFRETGIIHIVVLSGYNVMIVVETIMYLLAFAFFPRTRMVIGGLAILLFALLVGFSATVVRASIMATLLLIARGTGRTYAVLRALVLAGLGMLIVNPYLLVHDPGFQLSFLATLGLILFSPHVERTLQRIPVAFGARSIVTATCATQLFVLPLLLYHTGTFSIVTLIVNVLVLPMVPIAMLLTFLTGVLGILSSVLGMSMGFLAYLSLSYIIVVAELFGALPFAAFSIPAFPFWIVCILYAFLGFLLVRLTMETPKKKSQLSRTNDALAGWTIIGEDELLKSKNLIKAEEGPLPFR